MAGKEQKISKWHFQSLDKMECAVKKAFGTLESDSVHFCKGLIVEFFETESLAFNEQVTDCFKKYGAVPHCSCESFHYEDYPVCSSR